MLYSDEVLADIGKKLKSLDIERSLIGWELEELEEATRQNDLSRESDSDDE